MEQNLKTQGFYLIDVDVVALNNAGKDTSTNFENAVATKTISKNGRIYSYVSGQAIRYWWRETLKKDFQWNISPIIYGKKKNVVYTSINPLKYEDDDVFGYMRAEKDNTGDISATRVSPLKNSVLVSVSSVRPVKYQSCMARKEENPVLYTKQEYSAVMKGMFCLDLNMIGTFSDYNKTGYKNLSEDLRKDALDNYSAEEIDDAFVDGKKLVRLPFETRVKRATDTIAALKTIAGGAMQTSNMGDVTPKFVILATTNTGNHPFSHVVTSTGEQEEFVVFNDVALREVLTEYKNTFKGKVFIGRRTGFFDDYDEKLKTIQEEYADFVEYGPVNAMIDAYCKQLKDQMK
jgi:CRISPR-associated protein Cst2